MKMTGEYWISAPRETVWQALNDPTILAQAIPGCDSIEQTRENEMNAAATVKVGPVKAKFKGRVTLSDIMSLESYTITGEGKGGAAGFAKGSAHVRLTDDRDMTLLHYDVEARVGGKLAQVGQRLIDQTAKKMADDFFATFAALASEAPCEPMPAVASPQPVREGNGLAPAVWISGLVVFVFALVAVADKLPTGVPHF